MVGDDDLAKPSFFACYLLCSLNPRFKGRTYIGFTVNPKRRIRQHNGEIISGARTTQKRRPWEMILCVYGFQSQVHALQFEWAWQHPLTSIAVRDAAKKLKRRGGARGQVLLLFTMLNLPEWNSMNLVVNILSTKHQPVTKGCPSLPPHMLIKVGPLDDLPCYSFQHSELYGSAYECEFEDAEESDGNSTEDSRVVEALPFELTEECGEKINSSFSFTPRSPSFSIIPLSPLLSFTPLSPLWSCSPILNASGASMKKLGYSQAISGGGLSTKLFHDVPVSSQWNQLSPCSNVVSIQGASHCNPISCSVTPVKRQQLEVIDLTDSPALEACSIKNFIIV